MSHSSQEGGQDRIWFKRTMKGGIRSEGGNKVRVPAFWKKVGHCSGSLLAMSSLKVKIDNEMNCLSPRAKPDAEIDHVPNAEFTVESRAHLNPLYRDIALR